MELPEAEKCAPNISPSKRSDKSKWNLFFFFLTYIYFQGKFTPLSRRENGIMCPDYNVTTLQCNYKNNHKKTVFSFHQVSGSDMVTSRFIKGSER